MAPVRTRGRERPLDGRVVAITGAVDAVAWDVDRAARESCHRRALETADTR